MAVEYEPEITSMAQFLKQSKRKVKKKREKFKDLNFYFRCILATITNWRKTFILMLLTD